MSEINLANTSQHGDDREIHVGGETDSGLDTLPLKEVLMQDEGDSKYDFIEEFRGKSTFAVSLLLKSLTDFKDAALVPVMISEKLLNGQVDNFSNDLIDKVGVGLCYLKSVPHSQRVSVFDEMRFYPKTDDFLDRVDHNWLPFKLQVSKHKMNGETLHHLVLVTSTHDQDNLQHPEMHYTLHEDRNENWMSFLYYCSNCRLELYSHTYNPKSTCMTCASLITTKGCEPRPVGYPLGYVGGMFSSLFNGKSKQVVPRNKQSAVNFGFSKSVNHETSEAANRNAERETYQFDKPIQELGITDLIKQHENGERFLYAAITSSEGEEDASLIRRLGQFKPKLNRKPIELGQLPVLELFKDIETFPLSVVLPKKTQKTKTYIRIVDVIAMYGSLVSYDYSFTKAKICILDNRLMGSKVSKSATIGTNIVSKTNLSLSYCFPRDEAGDISLTVSREASFLEEGRQWGTIQLMIQLEETDFPTQYTNRAVSAFNNIPKGMLEDRQIDPDSIDITILNNDRKELREMYLEGDLADESEPIKNKLEAVKYAKSSMAGPRGKKVQEPVSSDWGFMKGSRQQGIGAGLNSIDPSEEGSVIVMQSDKAKEHLDLQRNQNSSARDSVESSVPEYKEKASPLNHAEGVVLRSAMKKQPRFSDEPSEYIPEEYPDANPFD